MRLMTVVVPLLPPNHPNYFYLPYSCTCPKTLGTPGCSWGVTSVATGGGYWMKSLSPTLHCTLRRTSMVSIMHRPAGGGQWLIIVLTWHGLNRKQSPMLLISYAVCREKNVHTCWERKAACAFISCARVLLLDYQLLPVPLLILQLPLSHRHPRCPHDFP